MTAINIASKLGLVSEHWSPKIVASFNGHDVMVVKLKGEFVWHSHADTDDFFYVVKGNLTLRLRDRDVLLGPGDLYVVPKGVEHCPVAAEEVHLLLIEPAGLGGQRNPLKSLDSDKRIQGNPSLGGERGAYGTQNVI